jgi:hypothetical protein
MQLVVAKNWPQPRRQPHRQHRDGFLEALPQTCRGVHVPVGLEPGPESFELAALGARDTPSQCRPNIGLAYPRHQRLQVARALCAAGSVRYHGAAEHILQRPAQGLDPVDHAQSAVRDLQPAPEQVEQLRADVRVLRRFQAEPQRHLLAVAGEAEGTMIVWPGGTDYCLV